MKSHMQAQVTNSLSWSATGTKVTQESRPLPLSGATRGKQAPRGDRHTPRDTGQPRQGTRPGVQRARALSACRAVSG